MKNIRNFDDYLYEAEAGMTSAAAAAPPGGKYTLSDTLTLGPKGVVIASDPKNASVITLSPSASPATKFKFKVEGTYSWFDFDVALRNVKKGADGSLSAEAQPQNAIVRKSMETLIPSKNLTSDKWLKVFVPANKLQAGLAEVKKNGGKQGKIDAGYGVGVLLTQA